MKQVLLIFISSFVMLACGQKPSGSNQKLKEDFFIESDHKACSRVNLYENIASKENIISLLDCSKLSLKYPELKKYLERIDEKKFSHLAYSVNTSFFHNRESRNKFFTSFINKTNKTGLESISYFLREFLKNKSNLSASISLLEGLRTNINTDILFKYVKFMAGLSKKTEGSRKNFGSQVKAHNAQESFNNVLSHLLEEIVLGDESLLEIYSAFLNDTQWLPLLVKVISKEDFSKILNFLNTKKQFRTNMLLMKESIDGHESYNCYSPHQDYKVDHSVEFSWQIDNLYKHSKDEFQNDLLALVTRFNLYAQICPEESFIPSTKKLLFDFVDFVRINGSFSILKKIATLSVEKNDEYMLFDLLNSDSLESLLTFVAKFRDTPDFSDSLYDLMSSLTSKDIKNLAFISEELFRDKDFRLDLKNVWRELKSSEQSSLISYVTTLFMTDESIYPAFQFLNSLREDMESESSSFLNKIFNKEISLLLEDFKEQLNNKAFRDELNSFLSNDGIIQLFSIIQKGAPSKDEPEVFIPIEPSMTKADKDSAFAGECLDHILLQMSKSSRLDDLVDNYPRSCRKILNQNFAYKIYEWGQDLNKSFQAFANERLVGENSLLNPKTMHFLHHLIHVTTIYVRNDGDFSQETVNKVKAYFFEKGGVSKIETALTDLISKNKKDNVIPRVLNEAFRVDDLSLNKEIKYGLGIIKTLTQKNITVLKKNKKSLELDLLFEQASKLGVKLDIHLLERTVKRLQRSKYSMYSFIELLRFMGEGYKDTTKSRASIIELILKEVDFSDNYYGIYFLNQLANGKSYFTISQRIKKNFKRALRFSSSLSFVGVLPRTAKSKFREVNKFIDILDDFNSMLPDGKVSYGDLLIELTKILRDLSPAKSRKIGTIRIPSKNKVFGHIGQVFIVAAQNNYLSLLSEYVVRSKPNFIRSFINEKEKKLLFKIESFLKQTRGDFEIPKKLDVLFVPDLLNSILEVPDDVKAHYLDYLKIILKDGLPGFELLGFGQYEILFDVLSHNSLNYVSLITTLRQLHLKDPQYLPKLIDYLLIKDSDNHTRLHLGLETMFIESNAELINFFKDILAHFDYKG